MELLGMMHGDDMMNGWMGGWMLLWGLVGLAALVFVIVGTTWLVRNMDRIGPVENARRELDLRYARGEMTAEEYDECRERIQSRERLSG